MKPEDLLDPSRLPTELQWVAAHHRLNPDDPVYLLIAWHWHRVQATEDAVQASIVELKAALDSRIEGLVDAADAIAAVNVGLAAVQREIAERPALLGRELETQLRQPVAAAVAQMDLAVKALNPALHALNAVGKRHVLAALTVGLALGALGGVLLGR